MRNLFANSSHVVIYPSSRDVNHDFALSLSVNGNRRSLMASSVTPSILKVSHTSKKLVMCSFRSSCGSPLN